MCYSNEVCETVWLKNLHQAFYICKHRDMHTTHICIALLKIFYHFKVTVIFLCFFLLLLTCSMQTNIWAFAFLSLCPFFVFYFIYIIFSMSRPQPFFLLFFLFFFSFPFCGRFRVVFGFQSVVSLTAHHFASLTIIIDFLLKLLLFGLLVACYACIYICSTWCSWTRALASLFRPCLT